MVPGGLEKTEKCVHWENVDPFPVVEKTDGGVKGDVRDSHTKVTAQEKEEHNTPEVYKPTTPLCLWPGTVQATVHSGASGSVKMAVNTGVGPAGTDCCIREVSQDKQVLEQGENRGAPCCNSGPANNTESSNDNLFTSSTHTSKPVHVIVDFLIRQGGVITVVLTVIHNSYSWLNAQDFQGIIRLEQAREERTRQRYERMASRPSESIGSSVEIGADIYHDFIEVEISDISSSVPSETGSPRAKAVSLPILGRSELRMARAAMTSLHQSISMTTLVGMVADGSVTSQKSSVSKFSIVSTGEYEGGQRDFHFGTSRNPNHMLNCTTAGPSCMLVENWMPSSLLHGKSKARSFVLKNIVRLASFSRTWSKRASKVRNLFCCGGMGLQSDDED